MKAKITLCKHPHENRYLMCWYNLQTKDFKFSFRVSKFVPKEIDRKLRSLHCTRYSKTSLEKEVSVFLEPYIETIVSSYTETLTLEYLLSEPSSKGLDSSFGEYSK